MESKFYDIKAFQQSTYRLEIQTECVKDRPVEIEQVYKPIGMLPKVSVANESLGLDDRDDVGEWRAEMHGIQDYCFD